MKWFRHEADAHTNLKLHQLIQKTGMAGYGYYWFLLELVAQQGENFRVVAGKNWRKFAEFGSGVGLDEQVKLLKVLVDLKLIDGKALQSGTLYIPKMGDYSDDYTKRVRRVYEQGSDDVRQQDNTTQDNTIQTEVNQLLSTFKKTINPVINFANTTQRLAAARLIRAFGLKVCIQVVEYIEKNKTDRFLPVITTPLQLEQKYGQLDQYRGKNK